MRIKKSIILLTFILFFICCVSNDPGSMGPASSGGTADCDVAEENDFWVKLQEGAISEATGLAVTISETRPVFSLFAAILYNMQTEYEKYSIYYFKYHRNPLRDVDLAGYMEPVLVRYAGKDILTFAGILFFENGNREQAVVHLEKALMLAPANALALNYLGMLSYETDPARFLKLSLEAIEIRPDYSEAYNNAAIALHTLGEIDKALEMQQQGVKNCTVLHENTFGNLLFLLGEKAMVERMRRGELNNEEGVELDRDTLDGLYALCAGDVVKLRALLDQLLVDSLLDGARYLLEAAEGQGLALPFRYYQANLAYLKEDRENFRILAGEALETEPLDSESLCELATDFLYIDDLENAILYYRAALQLLDTENLLMGMKIYSNLGIAYLLQGNPGAGIPCLEEALIYNPYDELVLFNLGQFYYDQGEAGQARHYLEQTMRYTSEERTKQHIRTMLDDLQKFGN